MPQPCIADSDTVALTGSAGVLSADVIVAAEPNNGLEVRANGLWSPDRPQLVSTLPVGPSDGDEIFFQDPAWTGGEAWHLRFNLAGVGGVYKWQFVGGSDLYVMVITAEVRGSGGAGYAALTTPVEIALPSAFDGDYEITHGAAITPDTLNVSATVHDDTVVGTAGGSGPPYALTAHLDHVAVDTSVSTQVARQSVKLGAAAATDNEACVADGTSASVSVSIRALGLAAGATLALVYSNASGSGGATFRRRWLRVRPVRVG